MSGSVVGLITYLIANYNQEAYVRVCLESLLNQSDPRWLAIVADDASTDKSLAAVRELRDERIAFLVNEQNLGYTRTLQRLISRATTEIVAILDADDTLEPDATATLLDAFDQNPEASLVYSRFAEYDESLTAIIGIHGGAIPRGGTAIIDGPVGAIRCFRRSAYDRTAGLDCAMEYAEDRDLVYKLEEISRPVFVDRVIYRYRAVVGSQARDPRKREIGAKNTWRARRAALSRRGVSGPTRLIAECAVACSYVAYSSRFNGPVRAAASAIASAASALWRAQMARTP
ncbi:MAG: glycosyltransferase family A protein, partial [Gemmatimonadales bacterium]